MIWLLFHPLPKLDRRHAGRLRKRDLADGRVWRGEGDGGGAKSYGGREIRVLYNHSILSGYFLSRKSKVDKIIRVLNASNNFMNVWREGLNA
jgi:hypothetical protein